MRVFRFGNRTWLTHVPINFVFGKLAGKVSSRVWHSMETKLMYKIVSIINRLE